MINQKSMEVNGFRNDFTMDVQDLVNKNIKH